MKSGHVSKFWVDLPILPNEKFYKLLKLGEYVNLGFSCNRWSFAMDVLKEVEAVIGDRISFDMHYLKEHIVGMEVTERDTRISITKGREPKKYNDVMRMKNLVEKILKADVRARSSDKWLYMRCLQEMGYDVYADFEEVTNLPSWETISRIRRKFQEHGLYPASEETFKIRKENEKQMHSINEWFGNEHE